MDNSKNNYKPTSLELWAQVIIVLAIAASSSYNHEMGWAIFFALCAVGIIGCSWLGDPNRTRDIDE